MLQPPKVAVSVGSALLNDDMLTAVILGGVDIFRIQQALFSREESLAYAKKARDVAARHGKRIEILFDYSGERMRIGTLASEVTVHGGDFVRFVRSENGDANSLPLPISVNDWAKLKSDERIFIADGTVQARIRDMSDEELVAVIEIVSAPIKTSDDVNFPDSDIHANPISERELEDFPEIALSGLVDWATLSFVENAEIIKSGKRLLGSVKLMAKIESEMGVSNCAAIAAAADGVMVARGDLAIQAPMERLGIYERKIINAAKAAGKPVMLATQFLESMVTNPIPLRAELSDVATAAMLGVDSILMTKEIAKGAYPLRALAIAKGTLAYTAAHAGELGALNT